MTEKTFTMNKNMPTLKWENPKNINASKILSELIQKYKSDWDEIENLRLVMEGLGLQSYQLTGNANEPVLTSYKIAEEYS